MVRAYLSTSLLIGACACVWVACSSPYEGEDGKAAPPPAAGNDAGGDGAPAAICGGLLCKAHERCDESAGAPRCACVVGYALENGACVFRGGPRDPSFKKEPPDAWTLSGNVSIDPAGSGTKPVDPGVARFRADGTISQSFEMPPFDLAEPLAVELALGCAEEHCKNVERAGAAFRIGDRRLGLAIEGPGPRPNQPEEFWRALHQREQWTLRTCLGDRAYGGMRSVSFTVFGVDKQDDDLVPEADALIDLLRYVPAADCPQRGVVANGDFDGVGGWTTFGNAKVEPAIGTAGSRGGRVELTDSTPAGFANVISIPEAMAKPSLSFSMRAGTAQRMTIELDGRRIFSVVGTNVFQKPIVCLPEWSRGLVVPLRVLVTGAGESLFDDFTMASGPSCPDHPLILSGDFESEAGSVWELGTTSATLPRAASEAHSGESYARLAVGCSSSTTLAQSIFVPPPNDVGGPAVKFWYRSSVPGATASAAGTTVPGSAQWTEYRACLPLTEVNGPYRLEFRLSSGTSSCSNSFSIDDVTVTNDAVCPSK